MKQPALALSVALATLPLGACRFANDNLVFATNASFGVDVDVAPNTVSVGYSRDEVSVGPITNEGEVLQVMASFSAGANILDSLFSAGISQSFAVGNAAYVLSKYLLVNANPALPDGRPIIEDPRLFTQSSATGARGTRAEETCYFFGTATNFGLKIGVGESGVSVSPFESLSFGYKRKELAFVPITQLDTNGEAPGGEVQVVPPLIATLVANSAVGADGEGDESLRASQLYATGHAATFLAAAPGIRATIGRPFVDEDGAESLDAVRNAAEVEAKRTVEFANVAAQSRTELAGAISMALDALPDERLVEARDALVAAGLAGADNTRLSGFAEADAAAQRRALKFLSLPGSGEERAAQLTRFRDALQQLTTP